MNSSELKLAHYVFNYHVFAINSVIDKLTKQSFPVLKQTCSPNQLFMYRLENRIDLEHRY